MKNGCPNQASKQLKPNGQMERMVKMTKNDQGERKKNPLLPPDQKPYMVTNSLWQRAIWQRLETHNPCTQYKPHNDASSHWALNRCSRSTHTLLFFIIKLSRLARHLKVTPIIPTSKKNETTQEAKRNTKRGKTNWQGDTEKERKKGEWQKKKKKKEQIPNFVSGVRALSVDSNWKLF